MRSGVILKRTFQSNGIRKEIAVSPLWLEGASSGWGGFTSTHPNGKAHYHRCQACHLFAGQTVTSLLKIHTPFTFSKFVTPFLLCWVCLASDQRPTCKRLKAEGGSVLLKIYLAIRWKTWLQGRKEWDTRKRQESQSWIKLVLMLDINKSVIKGLYFVLIHANFYTDEQCNEMVSKSL